MDKVSKVESLPEIIEEMGEDDKPAAESKMWWISWGHDLSGARSFLVLSESIRN